MGQILRFFCFECPSCFRLQLQGEGTYQKKLDVKTFPFDSSTRGHWSYNGWKTYMVRNWTQQFQIRIALHFFWILTGSRSFSRKLDLIWNWLGNFGKKSVQFQFIWYVFFLRISSPKSEQVLLFDILKAFESSFFCIDTVFVGWHWQVTLYLT